MRAAERHAVWVPTAGISFRGSPGIESIPHVIERANGRPLCRLAQCSSLTGDYRSVRDYAEQTATLMCDQCVRVLAAESDAGVMALEALASLPERVIRAIDRAGSALVARLPEHDIEAGRRDLENLLADMRLTLAGEKDHAQA